MSLTSGTRLGPYEIVAPLGAGGMGEVYRARDTRLGRDVALKVLPAGVAGDPERLARFEQEARAAAALNHPNILAVFDIGAETEAPYIVSELLEGATLREQLGSPLSARKAMDVAVQIAQGLAAAHARGIVHRDLKPENVFITADGRVKILDFGLAKLIEAAPAASALSVLPTMPNVGMSPDTVPGMVLGTVGYMAPEQVRGQSADHRADIFALGAVLYEMLTGTRAFRGDTVADAMSAILKEAPAEAPLSARSVPPALVRIVGKCIEKNPAARFQSAADLAFALESLSLHGDSSTALPAVRTRGGWLRDARVAWSAALVVGILACGAGWWYANASRSVDGELRVDIVTPSTIFAEHFALSPDGGRLVFVALEDGTPRLWLRTLSQPVATPLAGTDDAQRPFWSPDGLSVGFFARGRLMRLDIDGGAPQILANTTSTFGASWGDGVILLSGLNGPLLRVPSGGGEVSEVRGDVRGDVHRLPYFLPDGRRFLFFVGGRNAQGAYIGSLDNAAVVQIMPSVPTAPVFVPPDVLLFRRQTTLVAQRFNAATGALVGNATVITDGVISQTDINGTTGAVSVSATGRIAYRTGSTAQQLVWLDRAGRVLGAARVPDGRSVTDPALSADAGRVATASAEPGSTRDIWITDVARGVTTRATFESASETDPVWSPDGRQLVFGSDRNNRIRDLYIQASGSSGGEELLLQTPLTKSPLDWSSDGRMLLYAETNRTTGRDLWILPMTGERTPRVLVNTPFGEWNGQFSPDGRWVAYQSDATGRTEIYIRAVDGSRGQWQVSSEGGIMPRWRADGGELYYVAADSRLMAAPIQMSETGVAVSTPVPLFQTSINFATVVRSTYAVAADGRFLMTTLAGDGVASPITLLLNWSGPN